MTVSSQTSKVSYAGNGSTVTFSVPFYFLAAGDLKVIYRAANGTETVKVLTTDYTVSGAGNQAGGSITTTSAPAAGITVVIARNTPYTQEVDYQPNDPFPAETHEQALDKLTMEVQQVKEAVDRAIKLSQTNTMTSTEFTIGASDRANKIFAFDDAGELSITQAIGTYRSTWLTATSYAVRDIVKDTTNNNVYICITAHTSTGSLPLSSNAGIANWALLVDAAAAASSASAAATSATAAAASQSAAATSATNAANSASAAATSQTAAATSASNAASSASAASSSQTSASTSATNAANSATAAAASATSASGSATTATNQATTATTQATNASNSATAAATSETNAANSASAAATSATNAASSATSASSSSTAASSSATSASGSATSASNTYTTFDKRFLGSKTADPSLDNQGAALQTGALYWNSTSNVMKAWTGSAWSVAYAPTSGFLATSGGTMTGALTLAGNPSGNLEAAPKQYVDTMLPKAGGTMTGAITLPGNPSANLEAAPKQYVDTMLPKAGGTMTGALTMSNANIIASGTAQFRSICATDNARATGYKDSTGGDIGELNRSTEYFDDRIANCRGYMPNGNCSGNTSYNPPNGNWWTWGVAGVPTTNCTNNGQYDGAGGNTSTLQAVSVNFIYDGYYEAANEIGGSEQRRNYNNCNCGNCGGYSPAGFNCRTNCNCNCACDCNCACGDG